MRTTSLLDDTTDAELGSGGIIHARIVKIADPPPLIAVVAYALVHIVSESGS
jgi:hypothetical protein